MGYFAPRMMWTSVVSLARAAGVMGLWSKRRRWIVRTSLVLADMSIMSVSPCSTICTMTSRNSARLRYFTSPGCDSGDRPGAPMDNAMSGSFASARMKSLQPRGSAWMRLSFTSRVFSTSHTSTLAEPAAERLEADDDAPQELRDQGDPPRGVDENHHPQQHVDAGEDQLRPHLHVGDDPHAHEQYKRQCRDDESEHGRPPARKSERHVFCHAERGIGRPSTRGPAFPSADDDSCPFARTLPMRPSTWSMISRSTRADCCIPSRS